MALTLENTNKGGSKYYTFNYKFFSIDPEQIKVLWQTNKHIN